MPALLAEQRLSLGPSVVEGPGLRATVKAAVPRPPGGESGSKRGGGADLTLPGLA